MFLYLNLPPPPPVITQTIPYILLNVNIGQNKSIGIFSASIRFKIWMGRHGACIFCTHSENPIFVYPEMKLRSLVPNSYIQVLVSDLYIPRTGLPIWQQQSIQTDPGNI